VFHLLPPPPVKKHKDNILFFNKTIALNAIKPVMGIRDVYPGDPGSEFFHPGSRIQVHKDSGSRIRISIKEFKYFLTQKIVSRLSEL
jgi:hypothetical protein